MRSMRQLMLVSSLGACAPGGTAPPLPPGTSPTGGGEPITTQQVLQGIQIGEGGDPIPCDPVLTETHDADHLFVGLEGRWEGLVYAWEGQSGTADVSIVLDSTWEVTWVDQGDTGFDCDGEPALRVGALWLHASGGLDASVPVFAHSVDSPATRFVGEAQGADLHLDAERYDLSGTVVDDVLGIEVYTDLPYGERVGTLASP